MSRVEFNKCDNCEERFVDGADIIRVTIADHSEAKPTEMSSRDSYSLSHLLFGITAERVPEKKFEFCSPRCVVAAFIVAGAIANEVRL